MAKRLGDLLAELRTAETPVASTVHEPVGNPAGPGLWHHKGMQLPAYIQHVANRLREQGHPESQAVHMAVGIVQNWAAGHDGHGNRVSADVQAAAAKAVAEWDALKAAASGGKSSGRSAGMAHEYRAQMATADINDLPDSAFAYIEPGGTKDASGKTVPRSKRHFPVHDKAHADNAAARIAQGAEFGKEALPKVKAAQKKFGSGDSDGDGDSGRAWAAAAPERRNTPGIVEVRAADDGRRIGGYAIVFGKLSRNLGGFVERSAPGVVNQSRQAGWPGVVCRYNHNSDFVLGTTGAGTLRLSPDSVGLDYEVLPPQSRQDIMELVERRDVRFSSYAFRVPPGGDEWSVTDQNYPMRTLHEIQLVDVAPVLDPAYEDTSAGLRSLAMAVSAPLEEVRSMAAEDELRRFFVRTDRPAAAPPKPKVTAAAAMMKLMEKRRDPFA